MSFLVSLDQSKYPAQALDGFTATAPFSLVNARAMMWLSQLAYETAHQNDRENKITDILNSFSLTLIDFKSNQPETGLPPKSCCDPRTSMACPTLPGWP